MGSECSLGCYLHCNFLAHSLVFMYVIRLMRILTITFKVRIVSIYLAGDTEELSPFHIIFVSIFVIHNIWS
jgi:hypothetical protein